MDLYSRKIIAWTLSRTLEVPEVLECIKTAKRIRKTANPVIIQSDYAEFGIVPIVVYIIHLTDTKN